LGKLYWDFSPRNIGKKKGLIQLNGEKKGEEGLIGEGKVSLNSWGREFR